MKSLFGGGKKVSSSVNATVGSGSGSGDGAGAEEGGRTGNVVTNYRSFAEHHLQNSNFINNNNSNNNNNNSRQIRPNQSNANSVLSFHSSDEVLLEDQRNLMENKYRGFSTSMHDMYSSTEFERVDCCAMTCGGIWQSDRDRFLLQGITPPSIARRFWMHIVMPCMIFALACSGAMRIQDKLTNQLFTSATICLLFAYIVTQAFKGRHKRIEIRKELLWTKAQLQEDQNQNLTVLLEQHPPYDRGQEQQYYLGQTQRDFASAHPCCILSCYAEDRAAYELHFWGRNDDYNDEIEPGVAASAGAGARQRRHAHQSQRERERERQMAQDARRRKANVCRCLWDYSCPAICCGHQLQCCGICALAQEAREVESALLPAAYRRIDYISMQPISHYYPAIYIKRHGIVVDSNRAPQLQQQQRDGILRHDGAELTTSSSSSTGPWITLSNLSWQLIQFALTITSLVFIWCMFGKYFWKLGLGLNVPEWRIFNWTDFVVFLFAWAQALVLTAIIAFLCSRPCPTHLSLDAMIKFFAAGFCLSTALAVFWELFLGLLTKSVLSLIMAIAGVNVVVDHDGYQQTESWMGLVGDNFARTIAGKTDSDNFLHSFGNKHPILYTIYIAFASFCLASFIEEVCKYFGYRMVEHPDFMTQREIEDAMTVIIQQGEEDEEVGDDGSEDNEDEYDRAQLQLQRQEQQRRQQQDLEQIDFSKQKKSVQSLGAAITLSMICVAMGFACCENLVYVFIYSGSSLEMEISVLVARSLFPVHPIAAALQSLRVIERDVEVTRTARLGRILTPAVIFHGVYDFFILWIDFLSKRNGHYVNDLGFDFASFVSFIVSGCIIAAAILYYLIQASRQRARLQVTDASIAQGQSVLI